MSTTTIISGTIKLNFQTVESIFYRAVRMTIFLISRLVQFGMLVSTTELKMSSLAIIYPYKLKLSTNFCLELTFSWIAKCWFTQDKPTATGTSCQTLVGSLTYSCWLLEYFSHRSTRSYWWTSSCSNYFKWNVMKVSLWITHRLNISKAKGSTWMLKILIQKFGLCIT